MPTLTKEQQFEIVVKGMTKKFGKDFHMFQMKENRRVLDIQVNPTGLVSLDDALGVGGLPKGRVVEIYGPESGGKTTLALSCVAQVQKRGGLALIIDVEHALNPTWMAAQGVSEDVWVVQPDNGEQALSVALSAIESGIPDIVVLDSIAAIVPEAEVAGEMTDQQMGLQARILGKFFRKAIGPLQKSGCTLVCINQTRMMLGPMARETRPGGAALKFAATHVMRVKKFGDIKAGNEIIGVWIEVTVRKNKVAPPFKSCKIPLLFDRGFCGEMDLVNAAVEEKIVEKSGAWYSYKSERLGCGLTSAVSFLMSNKEMYETIEAEFRAARRKDIIIVSSEEEIEQVSEPDDTTDEGVEDV